jgi:hypothetical protein
MEKGLLIIQALSAIVFLIILLKMCKQVFFDK